MTLKIAQKNTQYFTLLITVEIKTCWIIACSYTVNHNVPAYPYSQANVTQATDILKRNHRRLAKITFSPFDHSRGLSFIVLCGAYTMANEVEIARPQKNTAQYYKFKLKSNLNWYIYNWAIVTEDCEILRTFQIIIC